MTLDQVLELGRMGYTKADIEAMENGTPPEAADSGKASEEPEPAPEPETKEPAAEPEPEKKEPAPELDEKTLKRLDGMEAQLSKILKAIQAENLRKDSFGSTPEDLETAADKALSSIINAGIERKE